jgi:nitrite reductase/ring-hydroxylating ferredoxin subunit
LRRAAEQAQELHDQRQPAPPTPYDLFTAIVGAAADSAERHDIAAQMIEAYWFNGAEWLGGELATMQVWEAALRFTEQARAAGYEWTADGWAKARGIATDPHPAVWKVDGKLDRSAGPKRNSVMAKLSTHAVVFTVTGARYRTRRDPCATDPPLGRVVSVNGCEIVLFRMGSAVFAADAICPHAGGDLAFGDVEDVPFCGPCITCPVHGFQFNALSGASVAPPGSYSLRTFPARLCEASDEIEVGFSRLDAAIFEDQDF